MNVFFDLDGPLLDVSERYYRVHREIVAGHPVPALGKEEFWEMKRRQVPVDALVAGADPALTPAQYREKWLERIERPEFLAYDRVVPGALEVLRTLQERHALYLVTLRRDGETLRWQLDRLGMHPAFRQVFWGQRDGVPGCQIKVERIRTAGLARARDVIVGDSEVDVLAGRELGMVTIATANGIRSADFLAQVAGAAVVIPDITALLPILDALQQRGVLA